MLLSLNQLLTKMNINKSRIVIKNLVFVLIAFVFFGFDTIRKNEQSTTKPFFFIQLSDTQIGFADNFHFDVETRNFEKTVECINKLKPAFVVITGDLVNNIDSIRQIKEFFRIYHTIDKKIPCYLVMGNHDVKKLPTNQTLETAKSFFGKDHYSFMQEGWKFIVLNSTIIQRPDSCLKQSDEQLEWLKEELTHSPEGRIIIFQHHLLFVNKSDESNKYDNISLPQRQIYLDLYEKYHVKAVFNGHLHMNKLNRYCETELITTQATSKSLGQDSVGIRIVEVYKNHIDHTFYPISKIPEKIIFDNEK